MNLQSSISFLPQITGPAQPDELPPEFVVYQPEPNWLDIVFPLVLLAFLISTLFWLFRQLRNSASRTLMAIESNNEGIRVVRESTEVSRETNRLLAELNDTLRRRIDSDH